MAFALPAWPGFVKADPFLISNSVSPDPVFDGEVQRFGRLGSKFGITVEMPPMDYNDARLWVAALLRAEREKVRMEWPQPGLSQISAPAVTIGAVSSANATVIALAGLPGGYTVLGGQFLNHVKDGVPRLHNVSQTGTSPLIISPPLRKPAAVGDKIELDLPVIEGWIDGPETPWSVDNAHLYGFTFTIREAA